MDFFSFNKSVNRAVKYNNSVLNILRVA